MNDYVHIEAGRPVQAERSIYPGKTGISGTYAFGKLGYSQFLPDAFATDPDRMARFQREANHRRT